MKSVAGYLGSFGAQLSLRTGCKILASLITSPLINIYLDTEAFQRLCELVGPMAYSGKDGSGGSTQRNSTQVAEQADCRNVVRVQEEIQVHDA